MLWSGLAACVCSDQGMLCICEQVTFVNLLLQSTFSVSNTDISKYLTSKSIVLDYFPVFICILTPVISNYWYFKVNILRNQTIYLRFQLFGMNFYFKSSRIDRYMIAQSKLIFHRLLLAILLEATFVIQKGRDSIDKGKGMGTSPTDCCSLKCLSILTPKTINFPFVPQKTNGF